MTARTEENRAAAQRESVRKQQLTAKHETPARDREKNNLSTTTTAFHEKETETNTNKKLSTMHPSKTKQM